MRKKQAARKKRRKHGYIANLYIAKNVKKAETVNISKQFKKRKNK